VCAIHAIPGKAFTFRLNNFRTLNPGTFSPSCHTKIGGTLSSNLAPRNHHPLRPSPPVRPPNPLSHPHSGDALRKFTSQFVCITLPICTIYVTYLHVKTICRPRLCVSLAARPSASSQCRTPEIHSHFVCGTVPTSTIHTTYQHAKIMCGPRLCGTVVFLARRFRLVIPQLLCFSSTSLPSVHSKVLVFSVSLRHGGAGDGTSVPDLVAGVPHHPLRPATPLSGSGPVSGWATNLPLAKMPSL